MLYVKTDDYSVAYPEEYKDMKYDGTEAWVTLEGAIRGDDTWMDQEIGSKQLTQADVTYGVMKEENEVKAVKVDTAARLVSAAEFLDSDETKTKRSICISVQTSTWKGRNGIPSTICAETSTETIIRSAICR